MKWKKKNKKENIISRRKEIIMIQAEINEKEIKETIVQINKTKSWFFEKINTLKHFQPNLSRKKERRIK